MLTELVVGRQSGTTPCGKVRKMRLGTGVIELGTGVIELEWPDPSV